MKNKKANGLVIYRGPSMIDGATIICVVTGFKKTKNPKTGDMLQSWILRDDVSPVQAFYEGKDYSVCGDCKHSIYGTCYVNLANAPLQVWRAYKKDRYDFINEDSISLFDGKKMRIGSYGEPTAVPFGIWNMLLKRVSGATSYTHQWKKCDSQFKNICMASVDSEKEAKDAINLGWKTFRTMIAGDKSMDNEISCPASNGKTTCSACGLCNGLSGSAKKCPTILVHGQGFKISRYTKISRLIRNKKGWKYLLPENLLAKIRN